MLVSFCLFLRDPQPVTRVTCALIFESFFGSHFLMFFWSQMVLPGDPKIAQRSDLAPPGSRRDVKGRPEASREQF